MSRADALLGVMRSVQQAAASAALTHLEQLNKGVVAVHAGCQVPEAHLAAVEDHDKIMRLLRSHLGRTASAQAVASTSSIHVCRQ